MFVAAISCVAARLYNLLRTPRSAIAVYMPAKNYLSQEQKERLIKLLKEPDGNYIREKALILLLINVGKTYQEISEFLEIAYKGSGLLVSSWRGEIIWILF